MADQKSPEIPAAIANCGRTRDAINSAADGCDVAGKSCNDYASAIDEAHHKVIHEMEMLGATVAVTEVVAAVLIPFTAGASEAVPKVVDVSKLAATGARIAEITRTFRAAAEMCHRPIDQQARTLDEVRDALRQLRTGNKKPNRELDVVGAGRQREQLNTDPLAGTVAEVDEHFALIHQPLLHRCSIDPNASWFTHRFPPPLQPILADRRCPVAYIYPLGVDTILA